MHDYIVMFENLFLERGLSLDRLKSFIEVHEAGGIARAAVGDPVRQSQYSRQIKELEEFFGVELVRRKGKGLELTRVGLELVRVVRENLGGLSEFQRVCQNSPMRISIGAGDSILHWLVVPKLGEIQEQHASIGFRLANMRSVDIVQELFDLRLDFGIVRKGVDTRALEKKLLGSFSYAFYVPRSWLAGKRKPAIGKVLAEIPIAAQGSDGTFRQELEANALKEGYRLNIRLNCESFPQAYHALLSEKYGAVLPAYVDRFIDTKKFIKYEDPLFDKQKRSIYLTWNPRLTRIRPFTAKVADDLCAQIKLVL
ncbi:MAG: LysR family transcriptional regulator [Verrucomicrobiota bacterium]